MRKKYISVIMLAIIMFSFVNEAFAVSEVYMLAPGILKAFDYSDIYDFNKFNEMYKQGYTSFISNKDITFYRHIYWADVFPDKSDSPKSVKFNNDSARNFNIMFYGDDRTVNPNPKDSLGNYNYMGYTKDNRNVTNIVYREDPLPKGTKVMPNPTEYVKKHGYKNARVEPFTTKYNDSRHVGELYLGKDSNVDEREKYGQEILKEWAKKVRNRDAWSSNDPRSDYTGKYKYLVDIPDFGGDTNKLLNSMTITVPPTSRSNGQAVAWFIKPDGTHTYRTFYIEKTDPVNFKALDYTWDEETKNLNIRFEIEGLEKVEGIITSYFEQERHQDKNGNYYTYKTKNLVDYFKEEYIAGWEIPYLWFYNTENIEYNTPYDEDLNISMLELEIDLEDPDFDMDYEYTEEDLWRFIRFKTIHVKPELENGKRKTIYDVDYDFSYLKDYRKEDIDLDFFINVYYGDLYEGIDPDDDFYPYMGFPEYHEGALDDNYMKVTIPATRLDFDLKHEDGEESRVFKIKDGVDAKIPVVAKLYNLEIEEDIE
ncbi:MAG: hypothetical protein GX992_02180, partial [Clostridium sp.]|nr:hypothetical protein [Clostridium sp.]